MHLIPGRRRRAGNGSVLPQKACSQGLLVKHVFLPPSLPITMNLQGTTLALLKHRTLVFTASAVYSAVASLTAMLVGLQGPSGSEQACARLGELLWGLHILKEA